MLKPCPFCGGEASENVTRYAKETMVARVNGQCEFYGVNCIYCGASSRGLIGAKTPAAAAEAWNRRVVPPAEPQA